LPTFEGLSAKMRALHWLVPPGKELSRVCRGFGDLQLARVDVESLAERLSEAEADGPGDMAGKRENRPEAIAKMLRELFPAGPPQMRNPEIINRLTTRFGATIGQLSERTISRAKTAAWPELKRRERT